MTDPYKPMSVERTATFEFNLKEHDLFILSGFLVRASQHLCAHLDASTGSQEWRKQVYREVFDDTTRTNHEGTGSAEEAAMLKANKMFAELLGVKN